MKLGGIFSRLGPFSQQDDRVEKGNVDQTHVQQHVAAGVHLLIGTFRCVLPTSMGSDF